MSKLKLSQERAGGSRPGSLATWAPALSLLSTWVPASLSTASQPINAMTHNSYTDTRPRLDKTLMTQYTARVEAWPAVDVTASLLGLHAMRR
ncbi:hypothetical protein E2C01_045941 [Portunus trituberculatus]|uniref:Uncharacterized protein n=1 Tax=Portunus trituberculatus TaxID=210409 RepID=A0A5B7FX41_PORTR|nr:hypothetical protein [Portunus trituberculatus]